MKSARRFSAHHSKKGQPWRVAALTKLVYEGVWFGLGMGLGEVSGQSFMSLTGRLGRSAFPCGGQNNVPKDAGLDEAQSGIKIAGRNINNLRYADDTTLDRKSTRLNSSHL